MKTERYYIIEEKVQGRWHTTAPSTNRYDLDMAKQRLEVCKKEYIGLDGIEDFRICEVEVVIRPLI